MDKSLASLGEREKDRERGTETDTETYTHTEYKLLIAEMKIHIATVPMEIFKKDNKGILGTTLYRQM